jgi:hypothetical protein
MFGLEDILELSKTHRNRIYAFKGIVRISKEHKGRNTLKFRVIDNVNAQSIAMSSGGRKVNADNDFIFALGRLGLDCKVN